MIISRRDRPILAGAVAEEERTPIAPIIGARPCRISRPLRRPPTHAGRWGRAWRVDLDAVRRRMIMAGTIPHDAMVVHWLVEAPWSSLVVHSYSLVCVHLRYQPGAPVERYLEGATHEVVLIAINPSAEREPMLQAPIDPEVWLSPPIFAAQIIESDDNAAATRISRAVELICDGKLSPHPTHVRSWAVLFGDNMLRHAVGGRSGNGEEKAL